MNKRFLEKEQWIVAEYSSHTYLKEQLLSNSKALTGIKFMTLPQLLLSIMPFTSEKFKLFTSAYTIIQDISVDCTVLNESICYPSVVSQLIDFTNLCIQYDIDLNTLSEENEKEIECKRLVKALYPLYRNIPSIGKLRQLHLDLSHVIIYPGYTSFLEDQIIQILKTKGAKVHSFPIIEPKNVSFYSALNIRQEVESCVQHILSHPETDFSIVLTNASNYMPTIHSVFKRYHLPYQHWNQSSPSLLLMQIQTLLKYYIHPSIDTLIPLLQNQTLTKENAAALIDYLIMFDCSIEDFFSPFESIQSSSTSFKHIDQRDYRKLVELEKSAEELRSSLQQVTSISNDDDPIIKTYDYFASIYETMTTDNQFIFQEFKSVIEQIYPSSSDSKIQETILLYALENLARRNTSEQTGIKIYDIKDLPYHNDTETFIILGCDQKSYPAFSGFTGLFDELYVEKTLLPSLSDRLQLHLHHQRRIFHYASNLIFSYAYANYEGKLQTCAFEIESFASRYTEHSFWPLIQHSTEYKQTYQLTDTISKELFFTENQLRGSISSFERFFQCPYQYFYQYGLKLQPLDYFKLNAAFIGTIQHAILEELSKEDPKHYASVPYETLTRAIQKAMSELTTIYPKKSHLWDFAARKMIDNLAQKLEFIELMERDTAFKNTAQEFKYNTVWEFKDLPSISISGIIDRIDETTTYIRIIDYKSSIKQLNDKKVEGGIQLQLCTYALIASSLIEKKLSGAYYLSLKNEDIPEIAHKVFRDKVLDIDETDLEKLWIKQNKLKGWTFDSVSTLYNSDQFITGLTSKLAVRGGVYQIDLIKDQLTRLYTYLLRSLSEGNVERRPVDATCTYCDFKDICRYRGKAYKPLDSLKDPKVTLQGKERKDAVDEMDN